MRNFLLIVFALTQFTIENAIAKAVLFGHQQDTTQIVRTMLPDSNYLKGYTKRYKAKKDTVELILDTTEIKDKLKNKDKLVTQKSIVSSRVSNISGTMSVSSTVTKVSGAIGGFADVSPTGAATYTIPIKLPPGLNGVMPQLTINYNSQAGNGIAGYGWNISGLSSITRIASTLFHDGVIDPVDYDELDRFALDGQRLILRSGIYGQPGAEYTTENASNIRVFSKSVSQPSDLYFEVWYPDGSKSFYGISSSSKTSENYAIASSENLNAAKIDYEYIKSNGVLYVDRILYGGVIGSTSPNTINFTYESSSAKEVSYLNTNSILLDKILSRINIVANNIPIKTYKFEHQQLLAFQYLNLIKVRELNGAETEELDPIDFYYQTAQTGVSLTEPITIDIGNVTSNNSKSITADFTGNGIMDLIVYPNAKDRFYCYWDPEKNTIPGLPNFSQEIVIPFKEIFPANILYQNNSVASGQGLYVVTQDYGTSSYKFRTYAGGSSYAPLIPQYTKEWNTPPMFPSFYSECYNYESEGGPIPLEFLSGDFNGDGLTDMIAINKGPYTYQSYEYMELCPDGYSYDCCHTEYGSINFSLAYFINMDRRSNDEVLEIGALQQVYNSNLGDKLYTADFNGDGKTDILHVRNGMLYVYGLNLNNQLTLLWQTPNTRIKNALPLLLGDYNGDGKTDLMQPVTDTGTDRNLYVHLYATGSSFNVFEKRHSFNYDKPLQDGSVIYIYNLTPTDLNGDGKTDLLYSRTKTTTNSSTGEIRTIPFYNTGMPGLTEAHNFVNGGLNVRTTTMRHNPIPIVLNPTKPNHKLEFGFLSHNTITLYNFLRDVRKETQLSSTSQSAVSYSFNYKEASDDIDYYDPIYYMPVYSSNTMLQYPFNNLKRIPGLNLVRTISKNSISNSMQQVFAYSNAVTDMQGLGFIGFGQIIRSNWHIDANDPNRMFNISLHDPLLRGAITKNFTSKNSNISTLITNASAVSPDLKIADPQVSTYTAEASQSVTLLPGFTANGSNGTFIAKINDPASGVNDGASSYDYITRTDYTYNTELLSNKVYRNVPTSVTVKDKLSGTNTLKTFEYDSYFNLAKETTNFSGQGTTSTELTYDNNTGNIDYHIGRPLTKRTTASAGGDTYTTEEQYTYTGFLPTQIKRKGHNTSFITENLTYNSFGNVSSKTLITANGQRTSSITYDATGRFITSATDTEGMTITYTHDAASGNVLTKTNPYNQTESYVYDDWGRLIEVTDFLGKKSYTNFIKFSSYTFINSSNEEGSFSQKGINELGQNYQVQSKNLLGLYPYKSFEYDNYGRVIKESEPYESLGMANQWNETTYDEYGRVTQATSHTGKATSISYNGLSTTVNDGTKSVTTTKNALGQTISVQDPGGTIGYTYDAAGNMKTSNYDGSVQSIVYDGWGRKTQLIDPSAGSYYYEYNDFGETTKEITPKGTTTYVYEPSTGKLLSKTLTGDGTQMGWSYTYDGATKLLNSLVLTNADGNNANYTYTYDSYKRPASVVEDNLHARFTKAFTYDAFGRMNTESSEAKNKTNNKTAAKTLQYHYQNGGLLKVTDYATGLRIHEINSLNFRGQVTSALMGNTLKQSDNYDSYGLPQTFNTQKLVGGSSTDLMSLGYNYNTQRALLTSRSNSAFNWNENFSYDSQDRLTNFNDNNGNNSHTYDNRGRINNNSQLGDYTYNNYQQTELNNLVPDANTWYQNRALQQISYNAFKSPIEIAEQGKEKISFQYNAGLQRAHMYYGGEIADKMSRRYRRHYSEDGSMEITNDIQSGTTSFVFYMGGDAYSAPAIWKEIHTSAQTTQQLYFLHRDHLGSIVMITNDAGNVVEKRQFDAWGNIVKLEDGNGNALTAFVILDRGYTGHEHLLGVGLIHMNGRLYDPKLHRFLQPDNYVQDPYNSQNFNRYGYVLNNPLKFTDPDGEFFLVAALLGGVINWAMNGAEFSWKGLGHFAVGAASGAIGAGVGQAVTASISVGGFAGGAIVGAAAGGAGGFVGGAGNAWVGGASFGSGLFAGLKSGVMGAIGGGLVGGTLSGIDAVRSDANFWNGKVNEVGGYVGSNGTYLKEEIPAGAKPTATGDIAQTSSNPDYGKYGYTRNGGAKPHFGVDYVGKEGDKVFAMYDGKVTQIGGSKAYGANFVRTSSVINGKTYNVDYGHMSKTVLTLKQAVNAKDLIGYMGRLGNLAGSTFPTHVHIAVWRPVNGLQGFVMPSWR